MLSPLDLDFCCAARRQGGFVDGEKPIWKNVPVNAAFGVLDTIGVVNNHFHPHDVMTGAESYGAMDRSSDCYRTPAGFAEWMMDLYYSLLNCGFRLPVSTGSASGVMPSWPGYERVYVNLTGPLTVEQWFRDLKAGRSVATNGPLLLVTCDDKLPGANTEWKPKMQLEDARYRIRARLAFSPARNERKRIFRKHVNDERGRDAGGLCSRKTLSGSTLAAINRSPRQPPH